MQQEELRYLFKEKISEGKDEKVVKKEINDLIISQSDFKILKRKIKKKDTEIANQDKQIEKLKKEVNELKNKLLQKGLGQLNEKIKEPNLKEKEPVVFRNINRILLMDCGKKYSCNMMVKELMLNTNSSSVPLYMNFLKKHKIIDFVISAGGYIRK